MPESNSTIEGIVVQPLRRIPDQRGTIMHGVRADTLLNPFGEVYFKKLYRGVINGWHVHETLALNYICLVGMMRTVLYDMRETSLTKGMFQEVFYGEDDYLLLHIPPGVANASQVIGGDMALFCNVASEPHDPSLKYRRIDPHSDEIRFDWEHRDF